MVSSPKTMCQSTILSIFSLGAPDSDLAHFLGDGAKMKKKSDLNPPLPRSQLKCFKNLVKLRRTILGLNIFPFSCKN